MTKREWMIAIILFVLTIIMLSLFVGNINVFFEKQKAENLCKEYSQSIEDYRKCMNPYKKKG